MLIMHGLLYCIIYWIVCHLLYIHFVWSKFLLTQHCSGVDFYYFTHTHTHTLCLSFSLKSNSIHIIYFGMIYFLLHMKHCCWFFSDTISHIHTQKCQNQQQSRNRLKIDFQFVDNIHVHRLHKWKDVMCAIFSWTYTVCFRNKYHPLWY